MTRKNETFTVSYSSKDIMDKLEEIHTEQKVTNGRLKYHDKLIFGAYSFSLTILIVLLGICLAPMG